MTLDAIFRGIGDAMLATFRMFENDLPITAFFNYGCIVLGFVGLAYWLNLQNKMTKKRIAEGKLP